MKLPENYQNWIEFAKKCDEFQKKHPEAKFAAEFRIDAVKAKAFDEVIELALAARKEVSSLKTGWGTDMAIMTRFLILLTVHFCLDPVL